jgi:cytochrome c oxidase cbb3-type subunit 3
MKQSMRPRGIRIAALVTASVILLGVLASVGAMHLRRERLRDRLLALEPDAAAADPALVRFAITQAQPSYATYCSSCHGSDLRGHPALGAPDLTDAVWLYGDGNAYDIERTILYGIRAGSGKTRNVTEMPAFGLTGKLSEAQIRSLVQYIRRLSGLERSGEPGSEATALFAANCADCHGFDARGNSDYGAPDLTRNVWNSGGDAQSLYRSIYSGQHHIMPAWFGVLSLEQIRALAVYLHSSSHAPVLARAR